MTESIPETSTNETNVLLTRDELVEVLRPHSQEIVKGDEWRSLAQHVHDLMQIAVARDRAKLYELLEPHCECSVCIHLYGEEP